MRWKGQFYLDLAIPFGLRSAPKIFTCFADVLQSIFKQIGGVQNIQHYLDDFSSLAHHSQQFVKQIYAVVYC